MAVDPVGNPVVAGLETVTGKGADMWLRKYDSSGNPVWMQTYSNPANFDDVFRGVAVDSLGNVIAAGFEGAANGGTDVSVRKYSSAGALVWTQTYDGAMNGGDGARGSRSIRMGMCSWVGSRPPEGPRGRTPGCASTCLELPLKLDFQTYLEASSPA